jgi:hypothetical protein
MMVNKKQIIIAPVNDNMDVAKLRRGDGDACVKNNKIWGALCGWGSTKYG